ncbi:hypothetical protein D088_890094 [Salmonella enterica subsp. houtenae serovar 16:z4,z32:-- str. RKS3027]|nr:hypothetical protein D088_890094 [Salmonella enterica subsp. houtenae serovar 16:z4,z32:-- str. RKS3027]
MDENIVHVTAIATDYVPVFNSPLCCGALKIAAMSLSDDDLYRRTYQQ